MSTTTTAIKERPILFSGPMVRAILEGRKTQTRRVVNPQPDIVYGLQCDRITACPGDVAIIHRRDCPFAVEIKLWVRETWASQIAPDESKYCIAYKADGECSGRIQDGAGGWMAIHHGWISGVATVESGRFYGRTRYGSWCPSIHMPRWASRLTLEITRVRVERLQDITFADCIAEGIHLIGREHPPNIVRREFQLLWDSINAKRGLAWAANPWVWVIDFRRTTP
jgi:hypothetical protein